MMKLSTMKKVVDTVDGNWRSPLAERILTRWGYDEGSVFYVRASANFIFVFKKEGKPYFLRFNDSSERDIEAIEAELKIVQYLKGNSLEVVQPIPSLNNNYIEVVETEWGIFHSVVFEALRGEQYDIEEMSVEQIYTWGASLGELHDILKKMPDQLLKDRLSWQDRLKMASELIPQRENSAHQELERLLKWAEELHVTKDNYGLIHYDFELDNILFDPSKTSMLDFDDCTGHWYVADIIYALRDVGDFDIHAPVIKEFIRGYRSKTEVDSNILQEASNFERMHKLITFSTLIRAVDINDSHDYPDWLLNLRGKIMGLIDSCR